MHSLKTKFGTRAFSAFAVASGLFLPSRASAQSDPDAAVAVDASAPPGETTPPTAGQFAALEERIRALEATHAAPQPPPAPPPAPAATVAPPPASSLDFAPAVTPFAF